MRDWLVLAVLIAASFSAAPSWAQPSEQERDTARTLVYRGDALAQQGQHEQALEAYLAADAIMGVPTTGVEVARMYAALGLLIEARDKANTVATSSVAANEPEPFVAARSAARKMAADVAARIPRIRVSVRGAMSDEDVVVRIDGDPVDATTEVEVNPGSHFVAVSAGAREATRDVTVGESVVEEVRIVLARAEESGTDVATPLMVTGFAIAGTGLIVGAITGALALTQTDEIRDGCAGDACPPSLTADRNAAERVANASNVSFAVGGAGLVLGVVALIIVLTDPSGDASDVVALEPSGISLRF